MKDVLERLMPRLQVTDSGCWEWQGYSARYGFIKAEGRSRPVHRVLWERVVGDVPDGHDLDHLCRNRLCANPDHLEVVTHRENVLRGVGPTAQNAARTHCKRGHEFDEANTYIMPDGNRACRACRSAWMRARRANP